MKYPDLTSIHKCHQSQSLHAYSLCVWKKSLRMLRHPLFVHRGQCLPDSLIEIVSTSGHHNLRENTESLERSQSTDAKTITENETYEETRIILL